MKFKKALSTIVLNTKKHSPALLMGAGLIGMGVTVIFAYKARPKVEKVIEYMEDCKDIDVTIDTVHVGTELSKALAIPVTTGLLSVGAMVWSYKIQYNRIATLSGVLATAQATAKIFDNKVRKHVGEEEYKKLVTEDEVIETSIDEDGNEIQTKAQIRAELDSTMGEWYDKSVEYFRDDHGYNLAYIDAMVDKCDLKLFSKGYLLLNDLRDALGFDRTKSGALLGWSTASYFNVEKITHSEFDKETGVEKKYIYVKWSAPKYIYGDMDLSPEL